MNDHEIEYSYYIVKVKHLESLKALISNLLKKDLIHKETFFSIGKIDWKLDPFDQNFMYTVCPRSSDPFYIVSYYIKWGTTSRTVAYDTL